MDDPHGARVTHGLQSASEHLGQLEKKNRVASQALKEAKGLDLTCHHWRMVTMMVNDEIHDEINDEINDKMNDEIHD